MSLYQTFQQWKAERTNRKAHQDYMHRAMHFAEAQVLHEVGELRDADYLRLWIKFYDAEETQIQRGFQTVPLENFLDDGTLEFHDQLLRELQQKNQGSTAYALETIDDARRARARLQREFTTEDVSL